MSKAVTDQSKPGLLDRLRARYGWFDHVLRANERYDDGKGNFFAAGLSYYTILALFPLLMVGFSAGGILLSRRPDLLDEIGHRIKASVPGELGQQVITLVDSAIQSRTSVGIIGLALAGWVGLTWMAHLREALSAMWEQRSEKRGFVRAKLSDLVAMVSAFVATIITLALTAVGDARPVAKMLGWLGVPDFEILGALLRVVSLAMSLLVSWLLFTWMIARLPREPISFVSATRAGVITAVGFELTKLIGSIYLRAVVNGPAGVVFGPVLGLMVFAYITARLVLFATAWAAVSEEKPPVDASVG
ncbi:MAG: inner membrane protein YhjD [Mycobacterium sp.]